MRMNQTEPADAELGDVAAIDRRVVMLLDPGSGAAQQYRMLALRLEHLIRSGVRRILVSSAVAGEGKTTIAANASIALAAMSGLRIVLVDASLQRPAIHRALGLGAEVGLADVLEGAISLDEALWQLDGTRLSVLPGGPPTPPSKCLASTEGETLVSGLSERFDAVILDGPTLLTSVDARWLASRADGTLLVVRARKTPRHLVELSVSALDGHAVIGAVVNDVNGVAGGSYGRLLSGSISPARLDPRPMRPLLGPRRAA